MGAVTSLVRAARSAAPLLACAVLAACGFETSFDQTRYQCGAQGACPSGFVCSGNVCLPAGEVPDARPDAPPGVETWTFDDIVDFGTTTEDRSNIVIAARGALEPPAYLTGAVVARGSSTFTFDDPAAATWDQVVNGAIGSRVGVIRTTDIQLGSRAPVGMGIATTAVDNWTIRGESEVFLDAGRWTFALQADDHGFLELSAGGGDFQRVVNASGGEVTGTFEAPATGWYPVRFALCDTGGNAGVRVRFSGPGVANAIAIPRHRLRARVDAVAGLVQYGWDDKLGKGDLAARIDTIELADIEWRNDAPTDLGLTAPDDFTIRWAGQLRIEQAGEFMFQYLSDDGQRLWIDGQKLTDLWDTISHSQTTLPVQLDVGWHDIVIDVTEGGGSANALLTVASGPELVGQALPLDRLRPVEARSVRFESGVNHADAALPDAGRVEVPIVFSAAPGARATSANVVVGFNHPSWSEVRGELVSPSGTVVELFPAPQSGAGGAVGHFQPTFTSPLAIDGTWRLRLLELQSNGTSGSATEFAMTLHYAGGEPPVATTASYQSSLRDLGSDRPEVLSVQWAPRAPAGSTVAIRARTCAVAADCADQAWSEPLADPAGSTLPFEAQRFLQWRAEMTSDGDATPSLESLFIEYRP
jgi:hypothetical protein